MYSRPVVVLVVAVVSLLEFSRRDNIQFSRRGTDRRRVHVARGADFVLRGPCASFVRFVCAARDAPAARSREDCCGYFIAIYP